MKVVNSILAACLLIASSIAVAQEAVVVPLGTAGTWSVERAWKVTGPTGTVFTCQLGEFTEDLDITDTALECWLVNNSPMKMIGKADGALVADPRG